MAADFQAWWDGLQSSDRQARRAAGRRPAARPPGRTRLSFFSPRQEICCKLKKEGKKVGKTTGLSPEIRERMAEEVIAKLRKFGFP